ncbi:FUSC family protein [Alkaliphilus serpentinus]|uniref:FUSC family protein n=1 Tax=Alkaliphilus serpentinus TaxID=1482731 RepID=UPI0018656EBF|nr:aromatic acid exporter family protein [Alkaliphilus serpentinus]
MKIGLRTIKTGIAVGITMMVSRLLGIDEPFFAMVAALIAIQPTVSDSWQAGINRMLGTFIGAIVGVIFIVITPKNFLMASLGLIILIHIMNRLKWNESINIASVVFIAVFLNYRDGYTSYALNRLFDTFIGISIALIVNYLIYPPTYDKKLMEETNHVLKDIWGNVVECFNLLLREEKTLDTLQRNTSEIEAEIDRVENLFKLHAKEGKMKIYDNSEFKEMEVRVKLSKEIYLHFQNLLGVMEKDIKGEVVNFIIEDLREIRSLLLKDTHDGGKGAEDNLHTAVDLIRQAKRRFKYNPDVNKFPSDEVIKLLVVIYNLEEILSKINFIKDL